MAGCVVRCSYNLSADRWEFYEAMSDCPDRIVYRRRVETTERADGVLVHDGVDGWLIERLSP